MKPYRLERAQEIPASLDEVWDFFSNPGSLSRMTPPWLGFRIISGSSEKIHKGMILKYRVSPVLRIPVTWVTEITEVEEKRKLVDEQRKGPYRLWRHEHVLKKKVEVRDAVSYALPFGIAGAIIHGLDTGKRLGRIFDFRREYLEKHFGEMPQQAP